MFSRNRRAAPAVEVRVPQNEARMILEELVKPPVRGCERVVIALGGLSTTTETEAALVSSPRPLPDEAYRPIAHGSAWDPKLTAQAAQEGMKKRLGVLIIHQHGFSDIPKLSPTDRASFEAVLPALKATVSNRPHGSLVLGTNESIGGLVWLPTKGVREITQARWIGSPTRRWPEPARIPTAARMYASQTGLIGERGQYLMSQVRIGIVGLGGGGSHVAQQGARAGFGSFTLVDSDLVEDKNRSRMIGSRRTDISRLKAAVIKRTIKEVSKEVEVIAMKEKFPSEGTIEALKRCDLVMSCVDNYSSRAELISFAWRHLIPLIDIGIGTETKQTEQGIGLSGLAGHMHVYVPGGPCMWCTGLLTKSKIDEETGGRPEYVKGVGGPGQIVSFNGVVASLAVTEAIQLVTGALLGRGRRRFIQYDGITPSLRFMDPPRNDSCELCNAELGAGDPVW